MKRRYTIKNKVLLLLLLAAAGTVKAQTHEFAPVGAEWHYEVHEMFAKGYIKMSVEKDTVINGIGCIKLQREKHYVDLQFNVLHDTWLVPKFLAYMNDSCMFYSNGQWHKLFDFSAEVGDTVSVSGMPEGVCMTNSCKVLITGKGAELVNGVLLKYFEMKDIQDSDWGWSGTIVGDEAGVVRVYERIGPVGSYFFPEQRCTFDYGEGGVLRCYQDLEIGSLNYSFPYVECDFISHTIGIQETCYGNRIEVFPNPCSGTICVSVEDAHEGASTLELFDMMGNRMLTLKSDKKTIEVAMDQFAQGVYLLKVTTNRNTVYKTLIRK